jgi:16S rRNA processing protein RimM
VERIAVARLIRARGNRGELAAESLTAQPERFQRLTRVYLEPSQREVEVEEVWWHQDRPIFKFKGVDTISDAETLANQQVCVPIEERIELAPGEFFYSDLVGCEVWQGERRIGKVSGWSETGGPVLLEVGPHLIPFVPDLCPQVDVAARRIEVRLPDGFLELND